MDAKVACLIFVFGCLLVLSQAQQGPGPLSQAIAGVDAGPGVVNIIPGEDGKIAGDLEFGRRCYWRNGRRRCYNNGNRNRRRCRSCGNNNRRRYWG